MRETTGTGPAGGSRSAHKLFRGLGRAVRSEGIGRTVLRLAWTAGPVTYVALQVGYYIAYGEPVPATIFFYFAGYTLVAGLTAVLVRVVYRATRGVQLEEDRASLERCLAALPPLLLRARDTALSAYDEQSARLIAARHLLQNPDATELAVSSAIRELGGSRDLAYSFQRIEVFRRNGMSSMVEAEYRGVSNEVGRLVEELAHSAPVTARLVADRAMGNPPSKSVGHERVEGFIERALAADSTDDTSLLTLADIEEIMGLAIELLSGREFPMVLFRFQGDRQASEAWSELERTRREYRTRLRSRNSRLRVLGELLAERIPEYLPAAPSLTAIPQLLTAVVEALESWARNLRGPRLRRRQQTEIEGFRRAVSVYRKLEEADRALVRCHARLAQSARHYRQLISQYSSPIDRPAQVARWIGSLFGVERKEIKLTEQQRFVCARRVDAIIQTLGRAATEEALRAVAVEIISSFESYIPFYRTEVQQAIELSRSPSFSSIEPGLSRKVLVDWVTALVEELDDSPQEYYVRRITQLVRYHGLVLNERNRTAIARQLGLEEQLLAPGELIHQQPETPWAQPPARVTPLSERLMDQIQRLDEDADSVAGDHQ